MNQEIVRFIDNYTSIKQWHFFKVADIIKNSKNPNRKVLNIKYDDIFTNAKIIAYFRKKDEYKW